MKRSKFSLSHYKLFSCDQGELIPCGMFEVMPGDTVQQSTSLLVRCTPLLAPVMHPVHVRIHHWYVPFRLIWNDWENFITGGPDGLNASVFPTKTIAASAGQLGDYLGVPPGPTLDMSALPFRAYALIWNEWYRDQDLETAVTVDLTDGADTTTPTGLQNCAWEKDYFTSARPWEQKGPSITIPIGTTAPIKGIGINASPAETADRTWTDSGNTPATALPSWISATSDIAIEATAQASTIPNIRADLSGASAVTINALREAMALQRFEEARARYGSRFVEYLRAAFGVRSSDARLARPEYLGGGRQTIQFSEVLQTGVTTSGNAAGVGTLRGHGITALRSNKYRRFFEEHGLVLSLLSVKPKTMYGNGLERMWNKRTKEDFFQKELQHIGQQEIQNKEVYAAHATPNGTFGWQDRYDEYRRKESSIAAEFRNTTADFWHMARIFAADPALNATFVKCVPTERTFASPSTDVLYIMASHNIQARRVVAKTGHSFIF